MNPFNITDEELEVLKKLGLSDEELREKFPALKDAWNQYQTVLKLIRSTIPNKEPSVEDIIEELRKYKKQEIIDNKWGRTSHPHKVYKY